MTNILKALEQAADDEPSVMGAGCGISPMPTREEAEAVWRKAFAARLVEAGALDQESADECAAAVDVDFQQDPAEAADDEIEYWGNDGDMA